MAKKKKHRKTRNQKVARQSVQATQSMESTKTIVSQSKPLSDAENTNNEPQQTSADQYVRQDIHRSLVLVGIVLIVFAMLWLAFEKTGLGSQLQSLFRL